MAYTMQYLIIIPGEKPALTPWFDAENNFNEESGMVVYDLYNGVFTSDGKHWEDIEFDHL